MSNNDQSQDKLIQAAHVARENAIAPYSRFRVGAALESDDGQIWTGCNIESSSFGLTVCAERVALLKALSEGARKFTRIVIAASGNGEVFPCGACRQLLYDFAPDLEVIILDENNGERSSQNISQLFPYPFSHNNLA